MAKFADAMVATLKALFETGDKPTEQNYADWIEAIQAGIEEHEHASTGGPGEGTGDAGPVVNVLSGLDAAKSATPAVGDMYIATDTTDLYVCYVAEAWTAIGANGGSQKFSQALDPLDATYPDDDSPQLYKDDGEWILPWWEARFDADGDEWLYFKFPIPEYYSGGNLKVTYYWIATATDGNVRWYFGVRYRAEGETWDDFFDYETAVNDPVQGVSEKLNVVSHTFDPPTAGDLVYLEVYRNGSSGQDTMNGDAKLLMVLVEEI